MLAAGKGLSDPPGLNALPTPTILWLAWATLPDQQAMGAQERTRGSLGHTKPDTHGCPLCQRQNYKHKLLFVN